MEDSSTGEGSSVDHVDAGNENTDDPMRTSDSEESKRKKMDYETDQQAANSQFLNTDTQPDEVGVELKDNYQLPSSTQDRIYEAPEQMQAGVDHSNQPEVLKKLKKEMSKCFKDPVDAGRLDDCIKKSSADPGMLLKFFTVLNAEQQKSIKEVKNSGQAVVPQSHKAQNSSSSSSSWWPYTVKVFSVVTGQTCGADQVILGKVKNIKWSTTQVEITPHWEESDIIIIFCPINSRVGSDVDAAMRKARGDKPVVLVLMHHTRDVNYSTDIKRWSDIFEKVVLDVHVLFHETQQGLLKCPRNDRAVQQIQKVLKDHK